MEENKEHVKMEEYKQDLVATISSLLSMAMEIDLLRKQLGVQTIYNLTFFVAIMYLLLERYL